jgi:hypothetical protein
MIAGWWVDLALFAAMLSILVGIAVALVEIGVGVLAAISYTSDLMSGSISWPLYQRLCPTVRGFLKMSRCSWTLLIRNTDG